MIKFEAMHWIADIVAALAYFVLGGLWFSPVGFQRFWDRGLGFVRPRHWKPTPKYFAVPLAGCFVITLGTDVLLNATDVRTLANAATIGLVAGVSYAATVTAVMSVAPTIPRSALLAAVVGAYHVIGIVMVATIVFAARQIHLT